MSNFLNPKTYAQATKNQPVAKELSLFEQTVQPVKDQKLPFDNERETEGDGNCFYNAIIDQIENNPRVADTVSDEAKRCSNPQELREKVIDFIKDWPNVLDTLLVSRDFMIEEFRKKRLNTKEDALQKVTKDILDIWEVIDCQKGGKTKKLIRCCKSNASTTCRGRKD